MSKTLTYSSFAVASVLVLLAFLTAKSYSQLAIAVILFPALAYFALVIFPRKAHKTTFTIQIPARSIPIPRAEEIRKEKAEVVDLDKRTFLKLAGTIGISFFLFSLLGDKLKALLFGGSSTSSGTAPTGSGNGATAGYNIAEVDEGAISYYGFTNNSGGWLIMKEDSQANSFRYAKGNSGFPDIWTNRQALQYDYFYNLH